MQYCEDCAKIQIPAGGTTYARCQDARAIQQDNGEKFVAKEFDVKVQRYCSAVRSDKELCGPDAAWFKTRE